MRVGGSGSFSVRHIGCHETRRCAGWSPGRGRGTGRQPARAPRATPTRWRFTTGRRHV